MWQCKQFGDKYVVSIDNHAEIVHALTDFCAQKGITAGAISGLGAVASATLRFFNPNTKKYVDSTFDEQMEIANLIGNVSTLNGQPYLHVHVTLGRADYTALAGHLLAAQLHGAGEFVVEDFRGKVERVFKPEIGLNFYHLTD